jgi:predicted Zn finger-like uncharacterized protein
MILTCPECKARYVVNPSALMPHGRTVRCAKCSHSWFEKKPEDDVEIVSPEQTAKADASAAAEQNIDDEDVADKNESADEETADTEGGATENSDAEADNDFDFPINKPRKRRRPVPKGSNLPALQNQKYGSSKMGWVSLAIFVTALISSFMIFQGTIVATWPASQKLYIAIGLVENSAAQTPAANKVVPIEDRLVIAGITPRRENINNISHLVIEGAVSNITDAQQTIPAIKVTLLDENRRNIRDWSFTPETTVIGPSGSVSFVTSLPSPPPGARDISVTFATN